MHFDQSSVLQKAILIDFQTPGGCRTNWELNSDDDYNCSFRFIFLGEISVILADKCSTMFTSSLLTSEHLPYKQLSPAPTGNKVDEPLSHYTQSFDPFLIYKYLLEQL